VNKELLEEMKDEIDNETWMMQKQLPSIIENEEKK